MNDAIIRAIGRCDPEEPLGPGDPRWQDFDPVRGATLHSRITRRLRGAESQKKYSHVALAGHRGCGKSTELARVQVEARAEGYLPLYAFVNEQADPNQIGFGDLFLLMLRMLDEAFRNGERWVGVHPLLWETPEFKAALGTKKRGRGLPLTV